MPLSENQNKRLRTFLSENPKTCANCGGTDWEGKEIAPTAAEVTISGEVKPSIDYVEVVCSACEHSAAVDCIEAGISDLYLAHISC
jgi:predicted nucleic-acid-binding Zn-ribbon protein